MGLIIVKDMEKQNCTIMTTTRKLPDDLSPIFLLIQIQLLVIIIIS